MHELAKKYGDVFSLQLGSRLTVILSSKEAIYEAYTKKARLFAGRPDFASFANTNHGSVGISLCTYDSTYEYNRKNTMRAIMRLYSEKSAFDELLHKEASKMMALFDQHIKANQPLNPTFAFKKIIPSAFLSMMFGEVSDYDDKEFLEIVEWYNNWFENAEADNPPDFFPFLKRFPNERLKIIGDCGRAFEEFATKKIIECQNEKNKLGLIYTLFEYFGNLSQLSPQNTRNFARVVADLCGGGFDTVASTLAWAPMYLLEKPHVLEKVRKEIHSVFGDSLVAYEKKDSVPYFCATLYDILRHSSVGPLGLPRVTMEDVELREFKIPKNTMVFVNLWACNHNPKEWKQTEFLHPENFLTESGEINQDSVKKLLTFSSGVRRCPGEKLSFQKIYILLGTMIQKYDFHIYNAPADKLPKRGVTLKPKDYTITLSRC